ncbi:MAG: ABC transporter substrate-binding protein [Deltaproteobacteria bacterium]|jgi:NitT/TauT family transport system substrate-binding protein|nr:ABC transporter substrate-binding protein [Deltaproteobacteria bacterium]
MPNPSRTGLAAALALALFLAAPSASSLSAQEAAAPKVIKAGYTGGLCEGPIHIAHERGFFKDEGLDVELIKLEPGANFEAIAAGQIDASFGLLATLIQPLSNGLPIKITTGLHTGCDKVLVKPDSGIKAAADLKGKRIGVPSLTSSPIMFARRALAAAGVKVGDKDSEVEFLVFTNAELPLALQRGAIDAISANDPVASLAAKSDGLTILLDSARDKPFSDQYCCAAYVSAALAGADPETAARYTRAMQKAAAWIQKNPDETAKIQVEKKYVAGDAEFNASVLRTFRYIPSVSGAYNAFGITAGELQQIGVLAERVNVEELRKNAFTELPGVPDSVE